MPWKTEKSMYLQDPHVHRTKQAVSGTLNAIALSDEFKDGTLRFSFSIEIQKKKLMKRSKH